MSELAVLIFQVSSAQAAVLIGASLVAAGFAEQTKGGGPGTRTFYRRLLKCSSALALVSLLAVVVAGIGLSFDLWALAGLALFGLSLVGLAILVVALLIHWWGKA